jgi:phosphogluconate dehydratase
VGGILAKIRDGDIVRVDAQAGTLEVKVEKSTLDARRASVPDLTANGYGLGRELFTLFRQAVSAADTGASVLGDAA